MRILRVALMIAAIVAWPAALFGAAPPDNWQRYKERFIRPEGRVLDTCLQLFGGYGYMWEFPIARAYADARVHRIFGGSNEIMRELIARAM